MARLFFITQGQISDNTVLFFEEDRRHLIAVRAKQGDTIACILLSDAHSHRKD